MMPLKGLKNYLDQTKTTKKIKDFDAVAFMRKQRDRISVDIANMGYEEI